MLGRREFFTVFLWRLILIAGAGYFLWRIKSLIIVVVLAVILYYCLAPFIKWFCRRKFLRKMRRDTRRVISAMLVIIIFLGMLIGASYSLVSPLIDEARNLKENITHYTRVLIRLVEELQQKFLGLPEEYQGMITGELTRLSEKLRQGIGVIIEKTISALGHLIEVFLIPIIAFYLAIGSRGLRRELFIFVPRKYARRAILILNAMDKAMRQYVVGQFAACLIIWIAAWGGLAIIGVDFPLFLGVIAGVTRAIPIIGPIVGGAIVVLLALVKSPLLALYALMFFSFLQFIDDKIILPLFIGHHMRLHPVTIVLSVFIGGEFFGILGMFMATPIAAAVKSLFQIYYTHGAKTA